MNDLTPALAQHGTRLTGLKCVMLSGGVRGNLDEPGRYRGLIRLPGAYILREELEKYGIEVEIIDYIQHFTDEQLYDLYDFIEDYEPDFITISDTFLEFDVVDGISKTIKMLKDIPIIAGGMNPHTHMYDAVDYKIYNYGENALIEVLEHHFCQKEVMFEMRGNTKFINATHTYKTWPKEDYAYRFRKEDLINEYDIGTLEFSRGCRFRCKFCNWPILGVKEDTSQKDIDSIVSMLNYNYENFGISFYIMADDTFNDRTEKLEKLAVIAETVNFDVRFSAFMRLDLVWSYPEQLDLMIRSKLTAPHFGVETFNEKAAKIIGKGKQAVIAKDMLIKLDKAFEEAGLDYHPSCSMIAGLPEETPEECIASQEWYREHYKKHVIWFPLDIHNDGENLSAFGEDMRKWGMELIDNKAFHNNMTKHLPATNWKNKHWTAASAARLAHKLNDMNLSKTISWYQGFANLPPNTKQHIPQRYIKQRLQDLR